MMAWTGYGWLAYPIIFGSTFVSIGVLDLLLGRGYSNQHSLTLACCMFAISAFSCWPVGRYFNRMLPRAVFDSDWAWKGRTMAHSAFFVRLEYGALAGLPYFIAVAIMGLDRLFSR